MKILLLGILCLAMFCQSAKANAESETATAAKLQEQTPQGFFDLYSENNFYDYDAVTDTRLRYYKPITEIYKVGVSIYLGTSIQYQSVDAREKYVDSAVDSYLGVQLQLYRGVTLQTQVGYRKEIAAVDPSPTTAWNPRTVLSVGDFWLWGIPNVFTEAYAEIVYLPRVYSTPPSNGWVKQGYRWSPLKKLKLDAYGEVAAWPSRGFATDLSPIEWRLGSRTLWQEPSWSVSFLAYHPFQNRTRSGEIAGLLVVGGGF